MVRDAPTVDDIAQLRDALASHILRTPLLRCLALERLMPAETRVFGKLEFLQRTGTFKARGALAVLQGLSDRQRALGVTAVSAGNHAIATAFAAQVTGSSAKIVMISTANRARIDACRAYGAELVMVDDVLTDGATKMESVAFLRPMTDGFRPDKSALEDGDIGGIEADIAALQAEIAAPDFYAQDAERVQGKLQELASTERRLEERMDRWSELETLRESFLK